MKPKFFMLVGLPGSGKSIQADKLKIQFNAAVHSSDAIRGELFGDQNCQQDHSKVFETLHRRVVDDLKVGRNVVYDATNIAYKRRIDFLNRISNIDCQKICFLMATPFEMCVERNRSRERVVPLDVLDRMYRSMWIPNKYEGWDYVELVYPDDFQSKSVSDLFNGNDGLNYVEQDNPHHTMTVGHHCIAAFSRVGNGSKELQEAALLHDIGKPYTKSFVNKRGETTEVAHYYDHHNVSAYDSLFYADAECDRVYVAGVIQWHMRPFEIERASDIKAAQEKFRSLVGSDIYNDVMTLHIADVAAKGC